MLLGPQAAGGHPDVFVLGLTAVAWLLRFRCDTTCTGSSATALVGTACFVPLVPGR